jgi:hypothetical protein
MTAIRQKYYFGGEASWALGPPSSPPGSSRGSAGPPAPLLKGQTAPAPLEIITEAGDGSMTALPGGDSANYPSQNLGDMILFEIFVLQGSCS